MFFLCKGNNMTELEALNMLLRLIGSLPVNDIESSQPDVANARAALTRVRRQAQRRGWWFNIDYNKTYTPNESKEIILSKEIISIVAHDTQYVKRGNKLYDKQNQTFQFNTSVSVYRETRVLEWDDMPEAMQSYCAYMAGAQFVRDELEDPSKQQELKEEAGLAMLDVKKQDLEEGRYNTFNKARVVKARAGTRPYHLGGTSRYIEGY